jgi:hypothetical protein
MARNIKVAAAVVNLRIHPHSPELYVELFRAVYRLRSPSQVHGDRYGLMSSANFTGASQGVVTGTFTTFTRLDTSGNWFDAANLQEATDEQVSEVTIPEGLFPNAAVYFFHFEIGRHRLFVETYSRGKVITPASILRFLKGLFGSPRIMQRFGEPSISLVQTTAGLKALFSIERIRRIEIALEKPNADIFADDFEEEVEKHLQEAQSQKVTIVYEAEAGKSVVATPSIQKIGEAALTNGQVKVIGRDKGVAVTKSSTDFPKVLQETYDPDNTNEQQAFNRLISND